MHARIDLPRLCRAEMVERLQRLSKDEELTSDARTSIILALQQAFSDDDLAWTLRIAYDVRAGMRTSAELSRIVADLSHEARRWP